MRVAAYRPSLWQSLESADVEEFQSFDLTSYYTGLVTSVTITIKGTGSGTDGFRLLDGKFLGNRVDNPTDTFHVSALISCATGCGETTSVEKYACEE